MAKTSKNHSFIFHRARQSARLDREYPSIYWLDPLLVQKPSINGVAADTRTVSLHVMSGAIFGKSYPFRGADEDDSSTNEDSSNYGEALRIILDRCIPLFVLGRKNLSKSWLPKSFRELYHATLVFKNI